MDWVKNDLSQKIDNLHYSISRLTNLNTVKKKGRFPSQPHQNPKVVHEVELEEGESSHMREVKAMITLRNGKEVYLPTTTPEQETEREVEEEKKEEFKGKRLRNNTKKEDHDLTVKEGPERNIRVEREQESLLTEQVSSIIQCKSLVKYKDPGCPTISVTIGGVPLERALLDLGASVNLLPYSVITTQKVLFHSL
ncbi:hypothetical protein AAG906_015289 [Vitis piasezkii]